MGKIGKIEEMITVTIRNFLAAQYQAIELDHEYFGFRAGDGSYYVSSFYGLVGGPFASEAEAGADAMNRRDERPID